MSRIVNGHATPNTHQDMIVMYPATPAPCPMNITPNGNSHMHTYSIAKFKLVADGKQFKPEVQFKARKD